MRMCSCSAKASNPSAVSVETVLVTGSKSRTESMTAALRVVGHTTRYVQVEVGWWKKTCVSGVFLEAFGCGECVRNGTSGGVVCLLAAVVAIARLLLVVLVRLGSTGAV